MKTKLFPVITDAINLILLYMLVIGACSILEVGMEISIGTYLMVAVAFALVAFYLLREYVTKLWLFALGNILVFVAVIFFAPEFNSGIGVGFIIFIFMILNAHFWTEPDGESAMNIPWPAFTTFVALSGYASSKGATYIVTRFFYFTVVFIGLEIVKQLLKNAYDLSVSGQLTSDMPVKEIYRNSFFGAIAVLLLCVGIMLFVRADWLVAFLNGILQKVEYALLYLFMYLLLLFNSPDPQTEATTRASKIIEPEVESGILDQIINIVGALLVLVVIFMLITLIIKGIRNLIKDYGHHERRNRRGRIYTNEYETRERIVRETKKREPGIFSRKTNEEKIRYMYKRKMLSYLKKGIFISNNLTPQENAKMVYDNSSNDVTGMTKIYERVRYSGEVAKDSDVTAMKEAIKNI